MREVFKTADKTEKFPRQVQFVGLFKSGKSSIIQKYLQLGGELEPKIPQNGTKVIQMVTKHVGYPR